MSEVVPGSARAYLLASRPQTLPAAFVPVSVGAAVAFREGAVRWLPVLAALLAALLIQVGTNLANDLFDFKKGADDENRLGPKRAAQQGWLTEAQLVRAIVVVFATAVLLGLTIVWAAGPVILAIGIASILAGIGYTGGPFPLAYNGLGDVFVIVFFGFVAVTGTTFVANGTFSVVALLVGAAIGSLANCILVVNNLRDREGDARVGKKTLLVRFGRRFGEIEYLVLLAVAYSIPVALYVSGLLGVGAFLPLGTLVLARRLVKQVRTLEGEPLNATLASTAKLLVLYGLAFAIGIAIPV